MTDHDHARMDDDGFLHHDKLLHRAERRLLKAAVRFCEATGDIDMFDEWDGRRAGEVLLAAYRAWRALH